MDSSGSMSSSRGGDATTVQVALRIRPQGQREKNEGSRVCTFVHPNEPQVTIGTDRSFTYDHVFDIPTQQPVVYEKCIEKLVDGTFEGFNATVLAYGQTGSGKTHTMGTAFDLSTVIEDHVGVIPRAIAHVFDRISRERAAAAEAGTLEPTFEVAVQFVELYNEEIMDLLSDDRGASANLRIHEDTRGEISIAGVTVKTVLDMAHTLETLKNGALNRTVAATNMNEQSSRSHAIFTLHIKQQRVVKLPEGEVSATGGETELEMLLAKFHFVDLAGSERLKRTGATGDRAKEGISINCGLLALGNVISALGGASGKVSHVPYRDSKLTRLLQDSLGGNSRTLMIACVSPSDSDFVETLNTLKYANRAKNIKNKVSANQDKSSKMLSEMRAKISALEGELLEFKQGRRTVDADGVDVVNDQYHENVMLTSEVNQLRFRVKALQETNEILRSRNVQLMTEKDTWAWGAGGGGGGGEEGGEEGGAVASTIRRYLEELESMRAHLYESQSTSEQLRRELARWKNQAMTGTPAALSSPFSSSFASEMKQQQRALIDEAKADIERLRQRAAEAETQAQGADTSDYASPTEGESQSEEGGEEMEDDPTVDHMQDDDDEEEEEEGQEADKECVLLQNNLADLQTEIGIKERLICELEKSERRLAEVRLSYEKKLTELSLKIKQTEAERDRVLAESASKGGTDKAAQEAAKKIREDYERKLADMRGEFKKLQSVEREHKRMQARQEMERQQLMRYQNELKDMKKAKVELMKKIKEETKRAQQQQMANQKRLAALDKEARRRDNQIAQLQSKDRQRELFMKRTTEEVNRLRKQARPVSTPMRTPAARPSTARTASQRAGLRAGQQTPFSPKQAKLKWSSIEKKLLRLATQKQTILKMEEELERRLAERHALLDEIAILERRFVSSRVTAEREELSEQMDGLKHKMDYIQDQITETQTGIMQVDGNKEDEDEWSMSSVEALLEGCGNLVEAKYLMQHLCDFGLEQAVAAARLLAANKESLARVQQLEQESYIQDQLLSQVIEGGDKHLASDLESLLDASLKRKNRPGSQRTGSTSPSSMTEVSDSSAAPSTDGKVRRRTATAEDLLYPTEPASPALTRRSDDDDRKSGRRGVAAAVPVPVASATHPPAFSRGNRLRATIGALPKKTVESGQAGQQQRRPLGFGRMQSSTRLTTLMEQQPSTSSAPPPAVPPPLTRKLSMGSVEGKEGRRTSVYARLIPSALGEPSSKSLINGKQGRIAAVRMTDKNQHRCVQRTHTLEGHSKSVLTVDATEEMLITGSKDRVAKLWDLTTSQEKCVLGVHPNNVNAVRFIPNSHLCVSVSMHQVRVWDTRSQQCIQILQSSGQVAEGDSSPVGSRQNAVPFLETQIVAAEVDPAGKLLFTSFCGDVRVWNLDRMGSFGRLVGAAHSPKSEVSCLRVTQGANGRPWVFTGSRDHYVKMYEVSPTGEGQVEPAVEFNPPHYDNVSCVLPYDNHLFTCSKDTNIMKFSLSDYKRDHLELKAHSGYVQAMCVVRGGGGGRNLLASGCKDGALKFWDIHASRRMKLVEEVPRAHSEGINEFASNSNLIFTASSDQTAGFWRPNVYTD